MTRACAVFTVTLLFATVSICAAGAPTAPSTSANVTLTFHKLTGQDGGPFSSEDEEGFRIKSAPGSAWLLGLNFGHPAPFVYVNVPPSSNVRSRLVVYRGGKTFNFAAVDLYSSITAIPYVFRGLLKGVSVFTARGVVPNTFGSFATVTNPRADVTIDTLELIVTDKTPACCRNPMGVDNIALTHVAPL